MLYFCLSYDTSLSRANTHRRTITFTHTINPTDCMSVDSGYSHRGTCHLHTERPRVGFKTRILLLRGNSENHCRMMTERLKQMNICWLLVSCGFNSMSCAVVLLVLSPCTASSWFSSLYSKDQSLVVVYTLPLQDIYKSQVSTEVNHRPTHCLQMSIGGNSK